MTGQELSKKIAEDTGKVLESMYQEALRLYKENGRKDYEAGIVEGLKRVMEEFGYK